jgi:beta-glucanase (GH16 family)
MRKKEIRLLAITVAVIIMTSFNKNQFIVNAETNSAVKEKVSNEYSLVWSDDFSGKSLDTKKWNYELHDPGWVNNELQSYTNSSDNVYVSDGNLVIQPIKTKDESSGKATYTSGRVNTKDKVDFKYGKVEVRAKLPKGQGIWPAIWMMPTDESLYGGWPKCGEVDIMELLGNNPSKVYQTLHYGKSSTDVQSQGSKTLSTGDFTTDYHVFSVEWEPGKMSFYVDGELTKTETKWYTGTEDVGIITYPAPFDQDFYVILNIAVGGNWPGNPDDTTDFTKAKMLVDYVKIYQKASYNENVTMPETTLTLRDPDVNGNYINNSDFSDSEALDDTTGWFLMSTSGGDAAASIADKTLTIISKSEGTVDYAIQAMQAGIPLEKGGQYKITFDAKAEADRSVILRVDGPNFNYLKYKEDQTVDLTTSYKTYSYDFTMSEDSDENGRLEFNLGAQKSSNPTATVQIMNVKLVKTGQLDVSKNESKEVKTVLADGNYIYNGTFDQGTNRFGNWEVSTNKVKAAVSVTNSKNVRKLKVIIPASSKKVEDVVVRQTGLALKADTTYVLTFDAKSLKAKAVQATVAGKTYKTNLTTKTKHYKFEFTTASNLKLNSAALKFLLGKEGTVYIDNVRIDKVISAGVELVQNGDFASGETNWTAYVDSGAAATYTFGDNKVNFDIKNAGNQNWHVQLKQSGLTFEKGKTYQVKATLKSSVDRNVELALMGNASKNYAYYGGDKMALTADKEYNYVGTFTMSSDSDPVSDLVFSFGKVGDGETPAGSVELASVSVVEVN